ncbi:MAG: Gfo/Idh/MocA family oxidoreductase [Coprobacillus sp.]
MKKIRIGIICPSEIALRRFMPALTKLNGQFEFSGVAVANVEEWDGKQNQKIKENELVKAQSFIDQYGGKVYKSYKTLINDKKIDAIYLPLPPALHYEWAKYALMNKKHVLVEKPSTIKSKDTVELISLAAENGLALHENYMFIYHDQIKTIKELINEKIIGDVRLLRADFGFPKRSANDFRYNKVLGGGALFDCGGYPIRLLSLLMGDIQVDSSKLIFNENDIDLYGSAQVSNDKHVAQLSFGMDNEYRCSLEIWGSQGVIRTNRIFSAPDSYACQIEIEKNHEIEVRQVEPDDTFKKSLEAFYQCVLEDDVRLKTYEELNKQMKLVEAIWKNSEEK